MTPKARIVPTGAGLNRMATLLAREIVPTGAGLNRVHLDASIVQAVTYTPAGLNREPDTVASPPYCPHVRGAEPSEAETVALIEELSLYS